MPWVEGGNPNPRPGCACLPLIDRLVRYFSAVFAGMSAAPEACQSIAHRFRKRSSMHTPVQDDDDEFSHTEDNRHTCFRR